MYRIAVTNRHLCRGDFLERIEMLARGGQYQRILLREKDLEKEEYVKLAGEVLAICKKYGKMCVFHNFPEAAYRWDHPFLHLPLPVLGEMPADERARFRELGTSVHSFLQAEQAEKLGATYMTAGHIFATDCKKGLEPRGLDFLRKICQAASVPVYGIGGITDENEALVTGQGAAGVCVMSGCMR